MTPAQRLNMSQPQGMAKVPIGCPVFWFPHLNPTLPWGWVECNGQVLDDPYSPLNGKTIPDMNCGIYAVSGQADKSGQTLGSNGVALAAANLPAVPITGTLGSASAGTPSGSVTVDSGGAHAHTVTDPGHFHDIDGISSGLIVGLTMIDAGGTGPKKGKTALKATGISVNSGGAHAHAATFAGSKMADHTHSISVSLNAGEQKPVDIRPASIVGRWIMRVK